MIDRRRGKGIGAVPYANVHKAEAWEGGWKMEREFMGLRA
jgi:hypothetical protein